MLLATPTRSVAQVTPADSAGVLVGVATRLQAEGRGQLARQLLQLVRDRYPNTPAAAEAARLLRDVERVVNDESGRTELMVFGATYGATLGVTLPIALEADDPTAWGFGLLLGAPAGFLLSRQYARSRSLSEGQASAIISGATWGAWQALGWRGVFDLGEEEDCFEPFPEGPSECYPGGPDEHTVMRWGIAGSLIGLGVGAMLSHKPIDQGTAATVNFGALWGTWFGSAMSILAGQDDGEHGVLTAALMGGNAGLVAAALADSKWQLSEQRARLISISGVAGLLAGMGLVVIMQPNEADDSLILLPLGGSIAGLALGARWTRHMQRDALIDAGNKRLGFQMPSVQPMMIDKGSERVPALGINLIQARF